MKTSTPLESLGIAGAIASSILWAGLCPVFYRFVEAEIVPVAAVFNRFGGSTLVLALWVSLQFVGGSRRSQGETKATVKDYGLLLASSLLFWLSQISWAWALTRTPVAISDLLHSLIPIFVILCGWLVARKSFTRQFVMGASISIAGSLIIGLEHLSDAASHKLEGDIASILSAVVLGVYVFLGEYLCEKFSNTTILLWVCLTGTVLSLPIALTTQAASFPTSAAARLSTVGLILVMLVGQGLFLYALQRVGSGLMSVLKLLEPVVSGVAAWMILSETLTYLDLVAMAIILWGVYLSTASPAETPAVAGESVQHG